MIGKFTVIMADPPWDIHMELPYGTMTDDEMRNMGVETVQVSVPRTWFRRVATLLYLSGIGIQALSSPSSAVCTSSSDFLVPYNSRRIFSYHKVKSHDVLAVPPRFHRRVI